MALGLSPPTHIVEDEKFTSENKERTYVALIKEPSTELLWWSDYLTSTDEESMTKSFQRFRRVLGHALKGATTDGYKATQNGLKKVFPKIKLQQCALHPLLRLNEALKRYRNSKNKPVSDKEISKLKKAYFKVLQAKSRKEFRERLKQLPDVFKTDYFLRPRYEALKRKAKLLTTHCRDPKLAVMTTSLDQTTKLLDKKLKMMGTFRDKVSAQAFSNAWTIARNFFRFYPGAKNAGRCPMELAGADLKGVPWVQIVNIIKNRKCFFVIEI